MVFELVRPKSNLIFYIGWMSRVKMIRKSKFFDSNTTHGRITYRSCPKLTPLIQTRPMTLQFGVSFRVNMKFYRTHMKIKKCSGKENLLHVLHQSLIQKMQNCSTRGTVRLARQLHHPLNQSDSSNFFICLTINSSMCT